MGRRTTRDRPRHERVVPGVGPLRMGLAGELGREIRPVDPQWLLSVRWRSTGSHEQGSSTVSRVMGVRQEMAATIRPNPEHQFDGGKAGQLAGLVVRTSLTRSPGTVGLQRKYR